MSAQRSTVRPARPPHSGRRRSATAPIFDAAMEALEQRRLLSVSLDNGVLTVTGTSGDDYTILRYNNLNGTFYVRENGVYSYVDYDQINSFVLDFGEGDDYYDGDSRIYKPSTVLGGAGNDTLQGNNGGDSMSGGDGDDILLGRAGTDEFWGDAGTDTASYSDRPSGAPAGISLDDQSNDGTPTERDNVHSDIEKIIGTNGNDTITGNDNDNFLNGNGGADTIVAGAGNDTLIGGAGSDDLDGGDGIDTVDYSASSWPLRITLDDVANDKDGSYDNVRSSNEIIIGGTGADSITGSINDETLIGNNGNDTLDGGDGNDVLDGGAFADSLIGGAGDDTLTGGAGADTLIGGSGINTFIAGGDGAIDTLYVQDGIDILQSVDPNDIINLI